MQIKQKSNFSSHIMKFVNNNAPVRSTNILIIIIPFLVLLAQPRILQADLPAKTRTQYSWGGPGDRYIRINGNTEVTRKTKNSTTKTTVNIPQQFINTLSELTKNGQGGFDLRILPSQLQGSNESGTKKFMVLTNNSLTALAALKESSLVPIVTKVTAFNDSNENIVKISQEKVGGAYDVDTGKIVYFNKKGEINNMSQMNGSMQNIDEGSNPLNANQLKNKVKATSSPSNTKTTVKSSIDTPRFEQSTAKPNQIFQANQSAASSIKNNLTLTSAIGTIQTKDRQKQSTQKNSTPFTNQFKPPNQLGNDFYGAGSNSKNTSPIIGSVQTVPNSAPYPLNPSGPTIANFPNQIGPSPPYQIEGTFQNNNQLVGSLEYNAYLNSLNQPVQVIREVTPFIVYGPIPNAPNSLNINPYQKDSADRKQVKQTNNRLQNKTAGGNNQKNKKEEQNLPFSTNVKQDQSLSNSLVQMVLPELIKYGQLNTNFANTANMSKINQQKNVSINIQNNDQNVNFSIPSNNSTNLTSVKINNNSLGPPPDKPPVPSLIGTPDFSIKIQEATKGSNNYTDITGKSSSFSQVDSLNHHITVLAVSTGRFGNNSAPNNSINNQNTNKNKNQSQKIGNNDIKIGVQKPNEGRNIVKGQTSKATEVKGIVTPIILNKTDADNNENKEAQKNSIQIEKQKKQNVEKLKNQNITSKVANNKIKVEQLLSVDQLKSISPIQLTYKQYRQRYKPREIATEQSSFKQMIYSANIRKINDHNFKVAKLELYSTQRPTYIMGLNQFTDLSQQQFYKTRLNLVIPPDIKNVAMSQVVLLPKNENGQLVNTIPEKVEINWSCHSKDQNTTFIDQGQCGASYVIAPLQSVQISIKMYGLNVQNLSVQQVLSCQPRGRFTNGCFSGFYLDTFDYLKGIGVGQNQYPYDSKSYRQGLTPECNFSVVKTKKYLKSKVFIQRSQRILYGDCRQVVNRLQKKALTAAIIAREGFQFYQTGIYSIKRIKGNKYEVDSTVTIVGYHPAKGYLIKNSWGDSWGQRGYAYVSDTSGICDFVIQPILADNIAAQPKPRKCV